MLIEQWCCNYLQEQLSLARPNLFFLLCRRFGETLFTYRRSFIVKRVDFSPGDFTLMGESEFGTFTNAD